MNKNDFIVKIVTVILWWSFLSFILWAGGYEFGHRYPIMMIYLLIGTIGAMAIFSQENNNDNI